MCTRTNLFSGLKPGPSSLACKTSSSPTHTLPPSSLARQHTHGDRTIGGQTRRDEGRGSLASVWSVGVVSCLVVVCPNCLGVSAPCCCHSLWVCVYVVDGNRVCKRACFKDLVAPNTSRDSSLSKAKVLHTSVSCMESAALYWYARVKVVFAE